MQTLQAQLVIATERLNPQLEIRFKPMFGGACAYLDGRVFALLFNLGLALKLAPDDQTQLLEIEGARLLQFEPDGPVMKAYVVVPPGVCADEVALANWVERSLDYVKGLPTPKTRSMKRAQG